MSAHFSEGTFPIKKITTDISHLIGKNGPIAYFYAGPSRAMSYCLIAVRPTPSAYAFVARFKWGTTITLSAEGKHGTYKITGISPQTITLELIQEEPI